MADESVLQSKVAELAVDLGVPGVAVGTLFDGAESHAFHGVTSIENPLPVDDTTLFQFGSTGKTYTSTAMLRLVEQGHGRLMVVAEIRPETAAVLRDAGEEVPEHQPALTLAFIDQDPDRYVVPEGDAQGMRGYFSRSSDGQADGIHLGGQLATRLAEVLV